MDTLKIETNQSKEQPAEYVSHKILKYKQANPEATTKEIAAAIGTTQSYVQSRLYLASRKLTIQKRGRPKKTAHVVKPTVENTEQHPLYEVFNKAINQAMHGKGERHGGAKTPFLEQPWKHYAQLHGRGFLTGQAAKKLEEAASTRDGTAFEDELLGAIVYIGMAIIYNRSKS